MVGRNHSLEETAEILRCRPRYLEDNLERFPHQKLGKAVAFDDDEIAAIKDMHRVRPELTAVQPEEPTQAPVLATIRPRRRRAG